MEDVTHPVLSLTLGREDHCDVELTFKQVEAVTFKLVAGSGPVHLVGQHYQETMRDGMDDTEFDDEEDAFTCQGQTRHPQYQKAQGSEGGQWRGENQRRPCIGETTVSLLEALCLRACESSSARCTLGSLYFIDSIPLTFLSVKLFYLSSLSMVIQLLQLKTIFC